MRRINAVIEERIRALEGYLPKSKLGLTGPAGVGKTQFALTVAARLSHKYRIGLITPESVNVVQRLSELDANLQNIVLAPKGDLVIFDDLTVFLESLPLHSIVDFLLSIPRPALLISQVRLTDVPAIRLPWAWRYVIDERLEFDGRYAYRRRLKGKKLLFEYRIFPQGFRIVSRFPPRSR